MSHAISIRDGEAIVLGIDQPEAVVHHFQPNGLLVLKVKGGSHWAGRGQRAYSGAEFHCYQVIKGSVAIDRENVIRLRANRVWWMPVRSDITDGRILSIALGMTNAKGSTDGE